MTSTASCPPVEPLPEASQEARRIVRKQLGLGIWAGLYQLVQLLLFLFSRHRTRKQMKDLIENSENTSGSD